MVETDKNKAKAIRPKKAIMRFLLALIVALIIVFLLSLFSLGIYKPAIYLYPEKSMPVRVSVKILNGYFTMTNPYIDAEGGWNVIANPNGGITQYGKNYSYLFYEGSTVASISEKEGWVVRGDNVSNWFDKMLPKMGLNENETKDFTDYWNQHLPKDNYYKIILLTPSEVNSIINLSIQPKPDTVIRVILVVEKLDKPVETTEPTIVTPERKGFTAVEWGVILKGGIN